MNDLEAILGRLRNLISIDTSVEMKNELPAALYIKDEFKERGIPARVYTPLAARGSVYARLEGKSPETLLILTHLDTAGFMEGAENKLIERDGLYFGRGTLDCKGIIAVWMQVIFDLFQELGKPEKTLAFLAAADEECGGSLGTGWLAEHTDCFHDVFLVIGEGGGFSVPSGHSWYFTLQTGEIGAEAPPGGDEIPIEMFRSEEDPIEEVRMIEEAIEKGYYHQNTLEYFLNGENFRSRRCVDRESFYKNIGGFLEHNPKSGVLSRHYSVFDQALKTFDPGWKLLPVISPGYSDNRFPRRKAIDTIGFFPLHPLNYIGGIHGRFECISEQSIRLSYQALKKIVQGMMY